MATVLQLLYNDVLARFSSAAWTDWPVCPLKWPAPPQKAQIVHMTDLSAHNCHCMKLGVLLLDADNPHSPFNSDDDTLPPLPMLRLDFLSSSLLNMW